MLEGYFYINSVLAAFCIEYFGIKGCSCSVYVLNKFLYTAFVMEAVFFFNFLFNIIDVSFAVFSEVL